MKNVLKGNYVDILKNDLFQRLYAEFGNLNKTNFSSNIIEHLNDFLNVNPQEYVYGDQFFNYINCFVTSFNIYFFLAL